MIRVPMVLYNKFTIEFYVKMQHFKPVISNDASLSGNPFPIVASHGLAGSKTGQSSLPVTIDV